MLENFYRFQLGNIVHFGAGKRHYEVKWRGWLVQEQAGFRRRYEVYWLGEETWDCYFSDQLWSVGQYPF